MWCSARAASRSWRRSPSPYAPPAAGCTRWPPTWLTPSSASDWSTRRWRPSAGSTYSSTTPASALPCPPPGRRRSSSASVIDVNLNGCYWMAQSCGRVMQPGSSIINISSILGLTTGGLPQAAYSASKAGLGGLTRDLAQQWMGRKGIRVNALAPGFFASEMTDTYPDGYLDQALQRVPPAAPATRASWPRPPCGWPPPQPATSTARRSRSTVASRSPDGQPMLRSHERRQARDDPVRTPPVGRLGQPLFTLAPANMPVLPHPSSDRVTDLRGPRAPRTRPPLSARTNALSSVSSRSDEPVSHASQPQSGWRSSTSTGSPTPT